MERFFKRKSIAVEEDLSDNNTQPSGDNPSRAGVDLSNLPLDPGKSMKLEYQTCLNASVECIRLILRQGWAFREDDESEDSNNGGNFLDLLQFVADHSDSINQVVLQNALKNNMLCHHDIQKDIVHAAATETRNAIIQDLGDEFFSILVDESRDISMEEQVTLVLRYVNRKGYVIERFLGIVHVTDTTALTLKATIESLFSKYGLSFARLRGQSYDGTSNMQEEFNGLKTLIMRENQSAYYVHCFAHHLQLTLIAVAQNHVEIASLFYLIGNIVKVVGASCKGHEILRDKLIERVSNALYNDEMSSSRGLNQETCLKRADDTLWGSQYGTIMNLILMFSSVVEVLEIIEKDGLQSEQRAKASSLIDSMESFEFVFTLHLMKNILAITDELSQALQRKDQDITNAMKLVKLSKQRLEMMRDNALEWESLLTQVLLFCGEHDISILSMNDTYVVPQRKNRRAHQITNLHHYRVELFCTVIDKQLIELNDRFTEANTELLVCVASLNPSDSFSAYDKQKLMRLSELYPSDFSAVQHMALDNQLQNYILDVRSSNEFSQLKGIGDLARKLVKTKKNLVYPLVFRLLKLALILPVAAASVERAFSATKIIKNRLRYQTGDQWMNDCLVTYIETDVFESIDNESIMKRFQNM